MAGFGYAGWALLENIKKNIEQKRSVRMGKEGYTSTKRIKREFNFPKVSEEELEKIKADIRAKGKRQRLIENSIISILSLTVFTLIYIYLF
ncbi:MAG: hypothetical protein PSN34_03545 [Urechidicola sp.]|nr:hypothetical protein [Urechidicola sp.]